jgi:hypothetical protein
MALTTTTMPRADSEIARGVAIASCWGMTAREGEILASESPNASTGISKILGRHPIIHENPAGVGRKLGKSRHER